MPGDGCKSPSVLGRVSWLKTFSWSLRRPRFRHEVDIIHPGGGHYFHRPPAHSYIQPPTDSNGWFRLSSGSVRDHTWKGRPGVYRLLRSWEGPVRYVGRSDTSVKRRLLDHAREDDYDYFFVEHKKMPIDAFVRECNLYHRHVNTVENEAHPNRPRGYRGPCPRCHEFR